MEEKGEEKRERYDDSWAQQSVNVETTVDSIVTLSRDNFRHACISVYNLRASLTAPRSK